MKKVLFILAAMMLAITPGVFAQQNVNQVPPQTQTQTSQVTTPIPPIIMSMPMSVDPWAISIEGGGLWSEKDNTRLHDGGEIIGRLTYDVTPNLALGGETGGLRFKDDIGGVNYGYLHGVPVLGDLVLKMPIASTGNRLVPYVYESAGFIVWSYHESDYSDSTGVDAPTRAHLASKPGAGLEYYLTPHLALFVEVSYLFSEKFHLKDAATSPPNGKIDVDSLYGGGGIKLAF